MKRLSFNRSFPLFVALVAAIVVTTSASFARDVDYNKQEVAVYVAPGEPTQISFPGAVAGGYRKKVSTLSLEHRGTDLVVFSNEALSDGGEALLVRLQDGRSFPVRIFKATPENPRDDLLQINDGTNGVIGNNEEEDEAPAYKEKNFGYAPPTQVSGLMRELALASEFGKANIKGYKVVDSYKGKKIFDDGTMRVTIDRIYMGTNLWGYVLDAENLGDIGQKVNPATFRIDGTRAVSMKSWELAARPMNVEQQLANAHTTKVYVIAKARK